VSERKEEERVREEVSRSRWRIDEGRRSSKQQRQKERLEVVEKTKVRRRGGWRVRSGQ